MYLATRQYAKHVVQLLRKQLPFLVEKRYQKYTSVDNRVIMIHKHYKD